MAALTRGEDGSRVMWDGERFDVDPAPVHEVVDTTGAGDMFAAGILYGLTNGLPFEQSARLAHHAAARIVSQLGARLAEPIAREDIPRLAGI